MVPISILAVAEKAHVSVMDALPHLMGMLMVMVTLSILWGVCAITAKLVKTFLPEPAASTAVKPTAPAVAPAPAGITPEIVAVVAATVATVTGGTHRIVSIERQSTGREKVDH